MDVMVGRPLSLSDSILESRESWNSRCLCSVLVDVEESGLFF